MHSVNKQKEYDNKSNMEKVETSVLEDKGESSDQNRKKKKKTRTNTDLTDGGHKSSSKDKSNRRSSMTKKRSSNRSSNKSNNKASDKSSNKKDKRKEFTDVEGKPSTKNILCNKNNEAAADALKNDRNVKNSGKSGDVQQGNERDTIMESIEWLQGNDMFLENMDTKIVEALTKLANIPMPRLLTFRTKKTAVDYAVHLLRTNESLLEKADEKDIKALSLLLLEQLSVFKQASEKKSFSGVTIPGEAPSVRATMGTDSHYDDLNPLSGTDKNDFPGTATEAAENPTHDKADKPMIEPTIAVLNGKIKKNIPDAVSTNCTDKPTNCGRLGDNSAPCLAQQIEINDCDDLSSSESTTESSFYDNSEAENGVVTAPAVLCSNRDIETAEGELLLTVTAYKKSKNAMTGIALKKVNGTIIVSEVSEDSIFKGPLPVGCEVISINGVSARDCNYQAGSMNKVMREAESKVTVTINEESVIQPQTNNSAVLTPTEKHLCCFCCCDCRTAVIIVNNLSLLFAAILVALVATSNETISSYYDDDDQRTVIVMAVVAMLFYLVGIVGAFKYSEWLVGMTAIWYCVEFGFALVSMNFIGAVIPALFAYPHFVLLHELRKGIW